jgi:nucleotide-binding universal stress UspA family protein
MTSTFPCPLPLDKILVCTDDSPASQGAVKTALDLGQACRARIVLLYVLEFYPYYEYPHPDALGVTPTLGQDLFETRQRVAREHLETWQQEAAQQGLELEVRLQTGTQAYAEILAAAEELKPDLIIMGRRGKSGLGRLLVGSVTARVIGQTSRKVLVAPRDATLSFERLLVASDGSPASQSAFQEALSIAKKTGSKLSLITAAYGELDTQRAKALVRDLGETAQRLEVPLATFTPGGRPEEAIIQMAVSKKINLIIMGSHGRTGLKRLFLGSVAERVIGQAACPVLVVKRAD